jgi:hypothetical protein
MFEVKKKSFFDNAKFKAKKLKFKFSMDGLFLENGPFRVEKNLTLTVNPGGWQNYATNVYGQYLELFSFFSAFFNT